MTAYHIIGLGGYVATILNRWDSREWPRGTLLNRWGGDVSDVTTPSENVSHWTDEGGCAATLWTAKRDCATISLNMWGVATQLPY